MSAGFSAKDPACVSKLGIREALCPRAGVVPGSLSAGVSMGATPKD